jgi:DNA-directed RNA polymerase specialized sigma24 family protein
MDSGQPIARDSAACVGEVTRMQRRLYAIIHSLVLRPADAEDILQECNLVLWRKRYPRFAATNAHRDEP